MIFYCQVLHQYFMQSEDEKHILTNQRFQKYCKASFLFLKGFFLRKKVNKELKIKKGHIDNAMHNKSYPGKGKIPCETVAKQTICTERPVSSALLRFGLWGWSTRVGNWGATPTRAGQGHHQRGTIPQRLSWADRAGSVAGATDRLAVSDPAKGELTGPGLRLVWEIPVMVREQPGAGLGSGVPPTWLGPGLGAPDPCAWVGVSLARLLRATDACWCLRGSDNGYLPWLQCKVLVLWRRPRFHCKIPMASGWWGNAANCEDRVGIFSCRFRGVISSEDVNWHSFVDHKTAVEGTGYHWHQTVLHSSMQEAAFWHFSYNFMGERLSSQEIPFQQSSFKNPICDLDRRGGRKRTVKYTSVLSGGIGFMLITLCRIFFCQRWLGW